jgi:two-component system, OmpR family, sensor histidine kinase TctE
MASAREQRSLFGEILDWMLAPLLLLWPMSVALTWLVAQNIANRPYDRELGDLARALAMQVRAEALHPERTSEAVRDELTRTASAMLRADDEDRMFFQVLGSRGELVAGDTALPVPLDPGNAAPNELRFRDEEVGGDSVRVAYLWLPRPDAPSELGPLVQLAETLDKRSRLATEIIKGVILPQFVILPLAVVLVWFALSRGIQPLSELQARIRKRESNDLSPIEANDVPEEVAPLVSAINDLLQRLDQSIAAQRHFLADAAHQLKTPLAGLRTQAELAEREIDSGQGDPASMKHTLRQIALSSQRAAHMVNQLLAMARAEDQEQALRQQPVNLAQVVKETVRDFVPKAMDKRIDLGYEGPDSDDAAALSGQPVLLRELVRNLVDNALQYTPAGGTVTARLTPDPFGQVVVLQVEDNGPGIAAAERDLVFRPFYRALGTEVDGSGLGLAIVSEIAAHHGAEISVEDACPPRPGSGPGALFTVRFPRGAPTADPAAAPAG